MKPTSLQVKYSFVLKMRTEAWSFCRANVTLHAGRFLLFESHGASVGGWRDLSCCRCILFDLYIFYKQRATYQEHLFLQKPKCFYMLDLSVAWKPLTRPALLCHQPYFVLLSSSWEWCCWRIPMTSRTGRVDWVTFNISLVLYYRCLPCNLILDRFMSPVKDN